MGRLWLQHVRMKRCLQSIEAYEAVVGGRPYDFIVRTRMDAKWFAPIPQSAVDRLLQVYPVFDVIPHRLGITPHKLEIARITPQCSHNY